MVLSGIKYQINIIKILITLKNEKNKYELLSNSPYYNFFPIFFYEKIKKCLFIGIQGQEGNLDKLVYFKKAENKNDNHQYIFEDNKKIISELIRDLNEKDICFIPKEYFQKYFYQKINNINSGINSFDKINRYTPIDNFSTPDPSFIWLSERKSELINGPTLLIFLYKIEFTAYKLYKITSSNSLKKKIINDCEYTIKQWDYLVRDAYNKIESIIGEIDDVEKHYDNQILFFGPFQNYLCDKINNDLKKGFFKITPDYLKSYFLQYAKKKFLKNNRTFNKNNNKKPLYFSQYTKKTNLKNKATFNKNNNKKSIKAWIKGTPRNNKNIDEYNTNIAFLKEGNFIKIIDIGMADDFSEESESVKSTPQRMKEIKSRTPKISNLGFKMFNNSKMSNSNNSNNSNNNSSTIFYRNSNSNNNNNIFNRNGMNKISI